MSYEMMDARDICSELDLGYFDHLSLECERLEHLVEALLVTMAEDQAERERLAATCRIQSDFIAEAMAATGLPEGATPSKFIEYLIETKGITDELADESNKIREELGLAASVPHEFVLKEIRRLIESPIRPITKDELMAKIAMLGWTT